MPNHKVSKTIFFPSADVNISARVKFDREQRDYFDVSIVVNASREYTFKVAFMTGLKRSNSMYILQQNSLSIVIRCNVYARSFEFYFDSTLNYWSANKS